MFSGQNSSSTTTKGLLVQNTAEQEAYRKRTLAIQRELRAMAVSLGANRRRFLKKRAELLRRSTSVPDESADMTGRRRADEERGIAAVRELSAVLERPRDEDRTEINTRQNATGEWYNNLDQDESCEQQPSKTALGTSQTSPVQPDGEITGQDSISTHRQDVSDTTDDTDRETGNQNVFLGDNRPRKYTRASSMTESQAVHVDGTDHHVVNRREMIRSPYARSTRSDSVSVTVAPPPPKSENSALLSRRMRGMTVGATEQLDLSRLRQVCDVRVGAHSPDVEREYVDNTQQRIKNFLERTSADSVVSDPSDLASESGSVMVTRRPSDRRRSVSRVYALERSPRLRKRSVPAKLTVTNCIEEERDAKDKLRLPPLSLPPVHNNVPVKLLPKNYSKRGHYYRESARIWTVEEWEDLKHCRYLRNKPIP